MTKCCLESLDCGRGAPALERTPAPLHWDRASRALVFPQSSEGPQYESARVGAKVESKGPTRATTNVAHETPIGVGETVRACVLAPGVTTGQSTCSQQDFRNGALLSARNASAAARYCADPPPLSGVKSSLCSCAGGVRRSPVGLVLATVNSGLGRGG